MHIVFASSECVPFAKTGGLADVVGALGPELAKLGHEVTVYLPLYTRVRRQIEGELKYAVRSITIPFEYYNRFVGIVDGGKRDGVQFYFVDCPEMFDRPELYGSGGQDYPDNPRRFALLCRGALEVMRDMRAHDIDMITIGQYLAPSGHHLPVARYVHPDTFKMFEAEAAAMGFTHAAVGALVRSSYHADQQAASAGVPNAVA